METGTVKVKIAAFLSWLSGSGIECSSKWELVDRQDGRGHCIVAAANFDEDEIVFSIPRSAVLNIQTAFPTRHSKDILDMPSWLALTTVMITESLREDTKWGPYFAILPQQLESLVFWSESELAELQASTVLHKIGKAKAEELFSQHIAPLGIEYCTTDLCHKVASIIMAYAFDIPENDVAVEDKNVGGQGEEELISDDEDEEKTVLSMIPLADMLNADADRNNARLCCDNEDLEMRTIKPIAKGEEIFNDYGQLPRADLLRRYGYITDNYALFDVAEISTQSILEAFRFGTNQIPTLEQLSKQDLEKRVKLAEREGVLEDSYDLVRSGPDGPSISDELLALVYILLIDQENVESISKSQSSVPSRSKITTELVGRVLKVLLTTREQEYMTTLEEDDQLEASGTLSRRHRMAIQVRRGEKKVLRDAIQEASSFAGDNTRMRLLKVAGTARVQNEKRRAEDAPQPKKKARVR